MVAQAGIPFSFNYTAADGAEALYVRAKVFDVSGGSPTLASTIQMQSIGGGVYAAKFTGTKDKVYAIVKEVCLDAGYTTVDPNRSPATDSVQMVDISGTVVNIGGGFVVSNQTQHILGGKGKAAIVKGEDSALSYQLVRDGSPWPDDSITEIEVRMKNEDGSVLVRTLTDSQVALNSTLTATTVLIDMPSAVTSLLKEGAAMPIEITVFEGALKRVLSLPTGLIVKAPIFT